MLLVCLLGRLGTIKVILQSPAEEQNLRIGLTWHV